MNLLRKFIRRKKRDRLLAKLNKANIFDKSIWNSLSPEGKNIHRLRNANWHRRDEWRASSFIIDFHETTPESAQGQAFLKTLCAGDLHYLVNEAFYSGRYDDDWILAFANHEFCDLGTAWAILLNSGSPLHIEKYLSKNPDDLSKPYGLFTADSARNDAVVKRMKTGNFLSRKYLPREPDSIRLYQAEVENALSNAQPLRWQPPASAYDDLEGLKETSRYEKDVDALYERFELWLAANP